MALLDSAEQLLSARPLADISLTDIASGAGLSRAGVYFYFDNKDALVEAAIARRVNELLKAISDWTASPDAPFATSAEQCIQACFAIWRRSGPLLTAAVGMLSHRPALRAAWEEYFHRCADILATAIERDRDRGLLPHHGDARAMALALSWMVERNAYMLYSRNHTEEEEQTLLTTLTLLCRQAVGATTPPNT
ncbi:TetR/AcrR family transcriptional regulator [Streptomyces sp. GMY02]|uniref:TetR/AcrR family transcriptional regulator n=1 Tax=Streptomyces sp. GMY02 TaxID=1333528 RepID=UPI001C2BD88F|nr:TetR/AcrR family transcriptional regulator [Streptomyces sp. GMY02]QXE38745.1 TetR/AcrR family transcriptional regulator [Streptomyces sp. GMY02]